MIGYPVEGNIKAAGIGLPISYKSSKIVCRKIAGMKFDKAQRFLNGLANENESINGKHFTKSAKYILEVLESAKNNADVKGIDGELRVRLAVADKGPRRMRGKRRRDFGTEMKNTHVKIILEPLKGGVSIKQPEPKVTQEVKEELQKAIEEGAREIEMKAEVMVAKEEKPQKKEVPKKKAAPKKAAKPAKKEVKKPAKKAAKKGKK
ncbi:MAG: hypothetical protein HZB68_05480 [Candidatus Aenigmarchaeota archaeon]|nr:hypothetical protein [Candidatus Aenigmarchaeota archaeon]